MVADPGRIRLDDHEVESRWERRQHLSVRERARGEHRPGGVAEVAPFPEVDGLLSQPERARPAGPDLDDHEARRRARVDRNQIELVATDMDVPGEDDPAFLGEPFRDEGLGVVAGPLRRGPRPRPRLGIHRAIVAAPPYPRLIWCFPRSDSLAVNTSPIPALIVDMGGERRSPQRRDP